MQQIGATCHAGKETVDMIRDFFFRGQGDFGGIVASRNTRLRAFNSGDEDSNSSGM